MQWCGALQVMVTEVIFVVVVIGVDVGIYE